MPDVADGSSAQRTAWVFSRHPSAIVSITVGSGLERADCQERFGSSRARSPCVASIFVRDRFGHTAILNVVDMVLLAAQERQNDIWQAGQVFGTMIHHASAAAAIVALAIAMVGAAFNALAVAAASCPQRLTPH